MPGVLRCAVSTNDGAHGVRTADLTCGRNSIRLKVDRQLCCDQSSLDEAALFTKSLHIVQKILDLGFHRERASILNSVESQ